MIPAFKPHVSHRSTIGLMKPDKAASGAVDSDIEQSANAIPGCERESGALIFPLLLRRKMPFVDNVKS